ncbi:contractile injection system tape measure protein [Algoriphagus confluentis]|uniref:Helicase XPB/Ssl2 N-terminal domain-containing protein n=1 Tax=Algoriphagus confluentis TaxID=1697556 RepID=A0ABQ6PPW7_9BACT|nr:hypothetical protein Aconfl_26520 [Algoriphagus confluentis]
MSNRHLIHRQTLELNYSNEEQARKDLPQWGDRFRSFILPTLEEVFDELIPSHRKIRLEKLELDLGRMARNLSREELKKRIRAELIEKIGYGPRVVPSSPSLGEKKHVHSRDMEQLIHLVRTGQYPWWIGLNERKSIGTLIFQIQKDSPIPLQKWLLSKPLDLKQSLRLHYHLGPKASQDLLSFLFPESERRLIRILRFLREAEKISLLRKNLMIHTFFQKAIEQAFVPRPDSGLWGKWLDEQVFSPKPEVSISPTALADFLLLFAQIPEVRKSWTKSGERNWALAREVFVGKKERTDAPENQAIIQAKAKFFKAIEKQENPKSSKQSLLTGKERIASPEEKIRLARSSPALEESYQIRNAGLVLAAPYFPFFFEGLDLTRNRKFISEQAQLRAVLLTQALLGTTSELEEGDLVLNKILCGVGLDLPIPLELIPNKPEQEEILNLLDSMAKNWTVLKSTSGKSMAKGFFFRTGMIRKVDQGFQLQIERNPIDLLVDRLPWTISIIKLPWMSQTLFTQW